MALIEIARYRNFWQRRSRLKPSLEMQKRAKEARREAQRLSGILADEFGAGRVYLFGSFVWGTEVRPDSDLDIAIEGLPRGKLVFALTRLSNETRYSVDLVLLERVPERLRNRIRESGTLLYERNPESVAG